MENVKENTTTTTTTTTMTPSANADLKCIIVQQSFTGNRQLKVTSIPKLAPPAEGEVLINVKACGVNFHDVLVRYGVYEETPKPPFVPGMECSGEVLDIGSNVTNVNRGDRVLALCRFNAWTEQVMCKKDLVFKIPNEMTFREAAGFGVSYITAYILLFELGQLRSGQTLFFHSAGGGVGVALTQLSKLVNNLTVIATASPHKFDVLKNHIHYLFEHDIDYTEDIKKICPEGIDLILDCMAGDDCERGLNLLKLNGKYIMYGTSSALTWDTKNFFGITKGLSQWWQNDKVSIKRLFEDSKSVHGFNLFQLLHRNGGSADTRRYIGDILQKVFSLFKAGKIKPVVDSVYTFEQVNDAISQLTERKNIGKVIIEPFSNSKPEKVKKLKPPSQKKSNHTSEEQSSPETSGPDEDNDDKTQHSEGEHA